MVDEYVPTTENEASFSDEEIEQMNVVHKDDEPQAEAVEVDDQRDEQDEQDDVMSSSDDFSEQHGQQSDNEEDSGQIQDDPDQSYDENVTSDEEYFEDLSNRVGLDIQSEEDIEAMAAHYRELLENPYGEIPVEAQLVADIINSGGDYRNALRLLTLDTEGMGERDLLRESYMLDSTNVGAELAGMRFEDDFSKKYGILDELNQITDPEERAEFELENERAIKLAKLSYEQDVKDAKERIDQYIGENTTNSQNISDEEQEQIYEEHIRGAQETLDTFDGIVFNFGENGEKEFNLKLNEEQSQELQSVLANPMDFYRETLGVDLINGRIVDHDAIAAIYTLVQNYDKLPSILGQFYMEQSDKRAVDDIVRNTERPRPQSSRPHREGGGIDLSPDPDW